jgi:hypothetical protein
MSGAFISIEEKKLDKLLDRIKTQLIKAEEMNLYLDSNINITKEDNIYKAYMHVGC